MTHSCRFRGCNVEDFLPFLCSYCNEHFCLDHRSQFAHECSSPLSLFQQQRGSTDQSCDSAVVDEGASVKSLFTNVTNRFRGDASEDLAKPREHWRITTTDKHDSTQKTNNRSCELAHRLETLDNVIHDKKKSAKQISISNKTKEIILKSKAKGDNKIAAADRIYLMVRFNPGDSYKTASLDESGRQRRQNDSVIEVPLYFSKRATVADALHYLSTNLTREAFGEAVKPECMSLVMGTFSVHEEPVFTLFNRKMLLESAVSNFDKVDIFVKPTLDVVNDQEALEKSLV